MISPRKPPDLSLVFICDSGVTYLSALGLQFLFWNPITCESEQLIQDHQDIAIVEGLQPLVVKFLQHLGDISAIRPSKTLQNEHTLKYRFLARYWDPRASPGYLPRSQRKDAINILVTSRLETAQTVLYSTLEPSRWGNHLNLRSVIRGNASCVGDRNSEDTMRFAVTHKFR